MATIKLDKLTVSELTALRSQVDAALSAAKAAQVEAVRAKISAMAAEAGLSVKEILGGKGKTRKVVAAGKYRNPKDPSQVWSGRGRRPVWLVSALAKGQKLTAFAA